eukprot:1844842-Amphidinium_carterae.1
MDYRENKHVIIFVRALWVGAWVAAPSVNHVDAANPAEAKVTGEIPVRVPSKPQNLLHVRQIVLTLSIKWEKILQFTHAGKGLLDTLFFTLCMQTRSTSEVSKNGKRTKCRPRRWDPPTRDTRRGWVLLTPANRGTAQLVRTACAAPALQRSAVAMTFTVAA